MTSAEAPDALERLQPQIFNLLRHKFYVDEFYQAPSSAGTTWLARVSDWFDRWIWNGAVWTRVICGARAFVACPIRGYIRCESGI